MSDLAQLRAKYLDKAPMPTRPVLRSHEHLERMQPPHRRSSNPQPTLATQSNAVQRSSDILTESSVSDRSAYKHAESQQGTIAAWRRSRSSVGASTNNPERYGRATLQSQTAHSQMLEQHTTCFADSAVAQASCLDDSRDPFKRSSSSGIAEHDMPMLTLQRSETGSVTYERHTGRYLSPLRSARGVNPAGSCRTYAQDVAMAKRSSSSGYLCTEQATPPPLAGRGMRSNAETCMVSSIDTIRTPLTDCLREFFAQRAASREQEAQEAAAAHDLLQEHETIEPSSSSCRIAAAAEARRRTAGALQAAQQLRL
jgi:hypothetical protein